MVVYLAVQLVVDGRNNFPFLLGAEFALFQFLLETLSVDRCMLGVHQIGVATLYSVLVVYGYVGIGNFVGVRSN